MHRSVSAALLLCGLSPAFAVEQIEPIPVEGKIDWVYRYAEGKQQAQTSGKPMFVVFRCER